MLFFKKIKLNNAKIGIKYASKLINIMYYVSIIISD